MINENQGKVSLAKVDIDELTDLSLEYGIQSVPVLAIMKDGKVVSSKNCRLIQSHQFIALIVKGSKDDWTSRHRQVAKMGCRIY